MKCISVKSCSKNVNQQVQGYAQSSRIYMTKYRQKRKKNLERVGSMCENETTIYD